MQQTIVIHRQYVLTAFVRPASGYMVRITHRNGGPSITTTTFAELDAMDSARRIVDLLARTLH